MDASNQARIDQPQWDDVQGWTGMDLRDSSGDKIGEVEDVYYDEETRQPEWLSIGVGWFGATRLIPVVRVRQTSQGLTVEYTKDEVKNAPAIKGDTISQDEERELYSYYGLSYGTQQSRSQLPLTGLGPVPGQATPSAAGPATMDTASRTVSPGPSAPPPAERFESHEPDLDTAGIESVDVSRARLREEKLQEERAQEERLREQRLQDERLQDERLRDERLRDERLRDERLRDERLRDERRAQEQWSQETPEQRRLDEERTGERFSAERPDDIAAAEARARQAEAAGSRDDALSSSESGSRDIGAAVSPSQSRVAQATGEPAERRDVRPPSQLLRLRRRVVTEPVQVTVPVEHEEVVVERVDESQAPASSRADTPRDLEDEGQSRRVA